MSEKLYNLTQLEELAGGDEDFVRSMIATFLEHTPGQLEEIKANGASGNLSQVGALAHKIKPNIDLFGIENIRETIREIERMGKGEEGGLEMQNHIKLLDQVLNQVFIQLKQY